MLIVQLTPMELMLAAHSAGLIRGIKQVQHSKGAVTNNRISRQDDFNIHYVGMLGEVAVGRVIGASIRSDITVGGDGKVDMEFMGDSIQIKTSTHAATSRERQFIFNSMDDFYCDWAVSCSIQSPTSVGIHGFISLRKFQRHATVENFGYGDRMCVAESLLTPIDRFREAVERSKEVAA